MVGLWKRRIKLVEDIPRYWDELVKSYNAKPVSFAKGDGKGGGDGCAIDLNKFIKDFVDSRRIE